MYFVDAEEENKVACKFYEKIINPTEKILIPRVFKAEKTKIFYFKRLKP